MNVFSGSQKVYQRAKVIALMKLFYRWCALAILPSLFIIAASWLYTAKGPFWFSYNADPSYFYLTNSLNIVMHKPIYLTDHPGTPVQMLGAIVLKLHHMDLSTNDLQTIVLQNPEHYLSSINTVITILNAMLLFTVGSVVWYMTKNIWLAMLIQCTPFFSMTILTDGINKVGPEPLLLFASLLIVAIAFIVTMNQKHNYFTIPMAIICGFGLATKFTFLPMAIIPFIVLSKIYRKIIFLCGTIISFIFFTLPIISEYKRIFYWIKGVLTHQGYYGQGNTHFFNYKNIFDNMATRFIDNPSFTVILTIAIILAIQQAILLKGNKKIFPKEFWLLISVLIAQIFGVLMCATRPSNDTNHYLLPFLCLSGITLYLIVFFLNRIVQFNIKAGFKGKRILWGGVFLFCFCTIIFNIKNTHADYNQKQENVRNINLKLDHYSQFLKIQYPMANSQEAALYVGNIYAGYEHSKCLEKIYGRIYFLSLKGRLTDWAYGSCYSFKSLLKCTHKIIFYGSCLDMLEYLEMLPSNFYISKDGNTVAISTIPTGLIIELQKDYQNELGQCIYVLK